MAHESPMPSSRLGYLAIGARPTAGAAPGAADRSAGVHCVPSLAVGLSAKQPHVRGRPARANCQHLPPRDSHLRSTARHVAVLASIRPNLVLETSAEQRCGPRPTPAPDIGSLRWAIPLPLCRLPRRPEGRRHRTTSGHRVAPPGIVDRAPIRTGESPCPTDGQRRTRRLSFVAHRAADGAHAPTTTQPPIRPQPAHRRRSKAVRPARAGGCCRGCHRRRESVLSATSFVRRHERKVGSFSCRRNDDRVPTRFDHLSKNVAG